MATILKLNPAGLEHILKVEAAPMVKALADRLRRPGPTSAIRDAEV